MQLYKESDQYSIFDLLLNRLRNTMAVEDEVDDSRLGLSKVVVYDNSVSSVAYKYILDMIARSIGSLYK